MRRGRTVITGATSFVPFNVGGTAATLDMDFRAGGYVGAQPTDLTVTRTGISTSGLSTDATGSSYTAFAPNTARIVSGSGIRIEESRTQYLGVTDTPATQTTASLGTGTYTLWVVGSGTATSSAGTATITGGGAATAGTPNTFTVTVAGTVTVTVSGSLTRFQLENGASATSYIPNTGAAGSSVARQVDAVSITGGAFSAFYTGGSSGTLYVEYLPDLSQTNSFPGYLAVYDASANNAMLILLNNSGYSVSNEGYVGGASQFGMGSTVLSAGAVAKSALAFATNDVAVCTNGGTVNTDTSATIPTPTVMRIGSLRNGSGMAVAFIRRVAYFPVRLSNAQIQALTT